MAARRRNRHWAKKMIGEEDPERKIIKQARAGGSADLVTMFLCFPLYAMVASLSGAGFVAIITGGGGLRSHLSWNKIWISLVNGGTAGACIGICCGLLSTIIYRLFHTGEPLHVSVDHAMDAVQSPLYWLGLAAGAAVAFATISIFRGSLIWEWRIF
jgi:hypothetical protein